MAEYELRVEALLREPPQQVAPAPKAQAPVERAATPPTTTRKDWEARGPKAVWQQGLVLSEDDLASWERHRDAELSRIRARGGLPQGLERVVGPDRVAEFHADAKLEQLSAYRAGVPIEILADPARLAKYNYRQAMRKIDRDRKVDRDRQARPATNGAREHIPQSVKDIVWNRDGGRCVECNSNERLEFDHIIPVIKGGSSTARNIQLLCESCNRRKGASL